MFVMLVRTRLLHLPFAVFSLTNTQDWMIKTWNFGMSMKEERSMATFR
jgi:hypothetical protein